MFGASFTKRPRVTGPGTAVAGEATVPDIVAGRIADLVAALASPGTNERLRLARKLVERKGINPATTAGKEELRGASTWLGSSHG